MLFFVIHEKWRDFMMHILRRLSHIIKIKDAGGAQSQTGIPMAETKNEMRQTGGVGMKRMRKILGRLKNPIMNREGRGCVELNDPVTQKCQNTCPSDTRRSKQENRPFTRTGLALFFVLLTWLLMASSSFAVETWTQLAAGTQSSLQDVTYGNGLFVTVGTWGRIMTSPDRITWTARTSGTDQTLKEVTYGNGLFVTVGQGGTILTSPDGITWTARNSGTHLRLWGVTYGKGLFVAVGEHGALRTSPDGINWTARTSGVTNWFEGVACDNNLFVMVGSSGMIRTSTDGITWTQRTSHTTQPLYQVAYVNGRFVTVGDGGTIRTSPDGINWAAPASGTTNAFWGVTYGNGFYVAMGSSGTVLTSTDANSWTAQNSGTTTYLLGVTYGDGIFMGVGHRGAILISKGQLAQVATPTLNSSGVASWTDVANESSYSVQLYKTVRDLPIGDISSAAVAHGLRKLNSVYTGPLIKIRRSSDGQLKDFYPDSNYGVLTLNSTDEVGTRLMDWIGVNNGTVHTWYDQTGKNRHSTQTTISNQPVIISGGLILTHSGRPAVRFTATSQSLNMGLTGQQVVSNQTNTTIITAVSQQDANDRGILGVVGWNSSDNFGMIARYGDGNTYFDVGDSGTWTGRTAGNITSVQSRLFIMTAQRNGATMFIRRDGHYPAALKTDASSNFTRDDSFRFGGYLGHMGELIIYNTAVNSDTLTTHHNNIGAYYEIPGYGTTLEAQGAAVSKTANTTSHNFLTQMRAAGAGEYTVRVTAVGTGSYMNGPQSVPSNSQTIIQLAQVATPTLNASGVASWTNVASNLGYSVQLYKGGVLNQTVTTGTNVNSYNFLARMREQGAGVYTVRVTALGNTTLVLQGAQSAASAGMSIVTISVTNTTKTFGDANFTITHSTNSTGAKTFSSSNTGVATITNAGVVTIVGAGTSTITFNVAATTTSVADTATATLTVNKANQAALTISPTTNHTYGTSRAYTVGGGAGTGAVSDSLSSGSATRTAALTYTANAGSGTYTISVTKAADANYNARTDTFTFTMIKANQAALTISPTTNHTYGTSRAYTVGGGAGTGAVSDSLSSGSATRTAALTYTANAGSGTYTISVTKAADANYNARTDTFTFTMIKANQAALT
jgi:hypothetical protein